MQLLGYGEDQLTLWALTSHLGEFLAQLNDQTLDEHVKVFFRPSFGRNSTRGAGTMRSEFGEFDAIVSTDRANYLVEAKWSSSSELQEDVVSLRPAQVRRHSVFRWYIDAWTAMNPSDWVAFRSRISEDFRNAFRGVGVPNSGTTLAANLEFILRQLVTPPRPLRDILLFTSVSAAPLPRAVRPDSFTLVAMRANPVGGAGFVSLNL